MRGGDSGAISVLKMEAISITQYASRHLPGERITAHSRGYVPLGETVPNHGHPHLVMRTLGPAYDDDDVIG